MPKVQLTKRFIDKTPLTTGKLVTFYWDSELKGFGMRVTATKKVFVVQARVNGKTRRVTIGNYGSITPKEARDQAQAKLTEMIKGIDPTAEKRKDKVQAVSLEQVVKSYLKAKALKPLSVKDINTHLNLNFKDWKGRPIIMVTRARVKKRFQEISKRSPAQANQAFRVFRALWNYAVAEYRDPDDQPIFGENPVNILSEQKLWNSVKSRDTKIPLNKMGEAWNIIHELRTSPIQTTASRTIADATAFILLTGCRLNEAASLTWDRVNTEEQWWHLDDPKNGRSITFPLSELACEILNERPRTNEFVFASRSKTGHITEIRTPMKKISASIGEAVSAHDLRRTFMAIALNNQIELWKAKLLLNHQESGVTVKHYIETSDLQYFKPEVNTISKWIVEQAKITKIENIIPMTDRRRA
jgi:integrase